jgi:hypothetical protein
MGTAVIFKHQIGVAILITVTGAVLGNPSVEIAGLYSSSKVSFGCRNLV